MGKKELTFTEMAECVAGNLEGKFEGSVNWYVEVVKPDLEARNIIGRTPKKRQLYRLKSDDN